MEGRGGRQGFPGRAEGATPPIQQLLKKTSEVKIYIDLDMRSMQIGPRELGPICQD